MNSDKHKQLIFVGGGGHCRSVIGMTIPLGHEIIGVVDPDEDAKTLEVKRIGNDDDLPKIAVNVPDAEFVITTGQIKSSKLRRILAEKLKVAKCRISTPLIAENATVSSFTKLGIGTVVLQNATINVNVTIGKHCIVNTNALIEHDCIIGDFCHISTGAIINGGVKIGDDVFIGSGSIINNNVSICANAIIGSGAVVTKDITVPGIYAGNPAKLINHN